MTNNSLTMETELSYTFEVQLSPNHNRLLSGGRWATPEAAAHRAGEFLCKAVQNGFTNASVTVIQVEEYNPLDL